MQDIRLPRSVPPQLAVLLPTAFTVALALLLVSCNNDSVAPPAAGADTTDYDFIMTSYKLGDLGSVLNDVSIINDTLAYAVGEIYGPDPAVTPFNILKWDGRTWTPGRAMPEYQGKPRYSTIDGVFALSPDDIWISNGGPVHGDGRNWHLYHLWDMGVLTKDDGSVTEIWGRKNDLYFAGNRGTAVHYDGKKWTRIETGTKVRFNDVWGAIDPETSEELVLGAVSESWRIAERRILRLKPDGTADSIPWGPNRNVESLWFQRPGRIFAAGSGLFIGDLHGNWIEQDLPLIYKEKVRGQAENDVFVVMHSGYIAHYNGRSWRVWHEPSIGLYNSCSYVGDLFVAVGTGIGGEEGVITMLRRVR
ncbi:MAG: hypothetical protein IPP94_01905 [Ignavibacteria bacterium]|nr:hypothetical protein [Ignavibacteria bacterium]